RFSRDWSSDVCSSDLFHLPFKNDIDAMNTNIIMKIRLPRVILAGLVGASLALAGAAFQGLLRNPLADPYTLGVSSGASVGAVCEIGRASCRESVVFTV